MLLLGCARDAQSSHASTAQASVRLGVHQLTFPASLLREVELRFAGGVRVEGGPAGLGETAEGRARREAETLRALTGEPPSVERRRWRGARGWLALAGGRAVLIVMPDATRVVRVVAPADRLDAVLEGRTHQVGALVFGAPALEHARFGDGRDRLRFDGRSVSTAGPDAAALRTQVHWSRSR